MSRRKPLAAVEAVPGTPETRPPEAGPSQTFQVREAVTNGAVPGGDEAAPVQTFQVREAAAVQVRPPHWDAAEKKEAEKRGHGEAETRRPGAAEKDSG